MAAWAGVTLATANATKVPGDMQTWMMKKGYDDYTDVAMACSDADGTEKAFVTRMKTDGVQSALDGGIGIVKLRKFWMACTGLLAAERKQKEVVDPNVEAPIPEPDAIDIAKRWEDRHNFVLPDRHLPIPNQQG